MFYSFIVTCRDKYFDCFIYPDISSLATLLENKVINIYCIMKHDTICAVYIFKTNETDIVLINAINANNSIDFFIHGFYYCLERIYKPLGLANVRIEGLSHCSLILQHILTVNSTIRYSKTGWYLYNYGSETKESKKVFILI